MTVSSLARQLGDQKLNDEPAPLPEVPDRSDGVKTPRGHHLKPEVKARIQELYAGGTTSASDIVQQIPGLTRRQANNFLLGLKDPNYRQRSQKKRAKELFPGKPDATAADYEREMHARGARKMLKDPDATAADYAREMHARLARKMLKNPNATAADYEREMHARRKTRVPEARDSGRPIVDLTSMAEAESRSWNAGDRFSVPHPDGTPSYWTVKQNRQGGEPVHEGDFEWTPLGG